MRGAMRGEEIPVLPRGVRLHQDRVRGGWVLLAPERTVALDQVGHAILSEVDGKRSLSEITAALAEAYNAPQDQIMQDSAGFLAALRSKRFLEVVTEVTAEVAT